MPPASFAVTRIRPPRPPAGLVERHALDARLAGALRSQRLTLLCAPAGYGKTSALARQLHALPAGTVPAWVSADADDTLQPFLACLAAALAPFSLPWRVLPDALPTLAMSEQGVRAVAGELVNALSAAEVERGLIVIDDAHRIREPRIFELLRWLLERLPDHWGLVIASRVEPPLPLPRLRARGELAEFRQADLRFSLPEVEALLAGHAQAPQGRAAELLARTDGWAVGLQLSLSALRHGTAARAPVQRHLFDFFATEVLDDMPQGLRGFLLRCAMLPELTAERCRRVSGDEQAAHWLDEIERRGLFVNVLEGDDLALQLHDLFRDFLEHRAQRELADEWPQLLRRAAEEEPDLARQVTYLARAEAWDEAMVALLRRGPQILATGGADTLARLLDLFPRAAFDTRPDLWMLRGLAAWPRYDFDALLDCMPRAADGYRLQGRERDAALADAHAAAGLQHAGRFEEGTRNLARARELALDDAAMAFIHYGSACDAFVCARSDEVAPMMAAMLDALERVPDLGLWHQCPLQAVFLGPPGVLAQARRYADAVERLGGDRPSVLRAGALHVRAWDALLAGDPARARQALDRAAEDCHRLGWPRLVRTDNLLAEAVLQALHGARDAACGAMQAVLEDVLRDSSPSYRRVHEADMLHLHARTAWILGDADEVRSAVARAQSAANGAQWPSAGAAHTLGAALAALADGRLDDARALLAPLAGDVDRHFFFPATQARALLAWTDLRLGRTDEAAVPMRALLADDAPPEAGAMVLAGPAVLHDLAGADWGARLAPAALDRLRRRAALFAPHERRPVAGDGAGHPLARLLSERELQVLERLAAGDSNKLIARALGLSPHTVKRHVANILDKLGCSSRVAAAARWRMPGA